MLEKTTIIFDLGNVVLTNDWHFDCPEKNEEFTKYFGVSEADMEKGWKANWPKYRLGKITEDEFWTGFLHKSGAQQLDINHAKKIWRTYQFEIENMLSLLTKLKRKHRLAALANIGKEWLDFKRAKFHLDDLFEHIIASGVVGYDKPHPKIYDLLLQKVGVSPQKCTYIDDLQSNLAPAEALGMKTILFSGQSELEKALARLQIKT